MIEILILVFLYHFLANQAEKKGQPRTFGWLGVGFWVVGESAGFFIRNNDENIAENIDEYILVKCPNCQNEIGISQESTTNFCPMCGKQLTDTQNDG